METKRQRLSVFNATQPNAGVRGAGFGDLYVRMFREIEAASTQ